MGQEFYDAMIEVRQMEVDNAVKDKAKEINEIYDGYVQGLENAKQNINNPALMEKFLLDAIQEINEIRKEVLAVLEDAKELELERIDLEYECFKSKNRCFDFAGTIAKQNETIKELQKELGEYNKKDTV